MNSRTETDNILSNFEHKPSTFSLNLVFDDGPFCTGCTSHYNMSRPWPCPYSTFEDVLSVDEFAAAFASVVNLIEDDDSAIAIDEDMDETYPSWMFFSLSSVGLISRSWYAWMPGENYRQGREKIRKT